MKPYIREMTQTQSMRPEKKEEVDLLALQIVSMQIFRDTSSIQKGAKEN